jgi:hypothetical protein
MPPAQGVFEAALGPAEGGVLLLRFDNTHSCEQQHY